MLFFVTKLQTIQFAKNRKLIGVKAFDLGIYIDRISSTPTMQTSLNEINSMNKKTTFFFLKIKLNKIHTMQIVWILLPIRIWVVTKWIRFFFLLSVICLLWFCSVVEVYLISLWLHSVTKEFIFKKN